jgi:hypothetical protein
VSEVDSYKHLHPLLTINDYLYTKKYMGFLVKAFAIFWVLWILWYITGGPLRDDKSKPYIGFNETGQLVPLGTSTIQTK